MTDIAHSDVVNLVHNSGVVVRLVVVRAPNIEDAITAHHHHHHQQKQQQELSAADMAAKLKKSLDDVRGWITVSSCLLSHSFWNERLSESYISNISFLLF